MKRTLLIFTLAYASNIRGLDNHTSTENGVLFSIDSADSLSNIPSLNSALSRATFIGRNIVYSPLSQGLLVNIMTNKAVFDNSSKLLRFVPTDTNEALRKVANNLCDSSTSRLKLYIDVYYDESKSPKAREYLQKLSSIYRIEAHNVSINLSNSELTTSLTNGWIQAKSKGRVDKFTKNTSVPVITASESSIELILITYIDCWHKPKTSTSLKFNNDVNQTTIAAFHSKESLGYHDNPRRQYEAIRLPFRSDYSMLILLPYENSSLESIKNLTGSDYRELFRQVTEHRENIDYFVPILNLTSFTMDTNGASLYDDYSINCEHQFSRQETSQIDETEFKAFHVNRPFIFMIYHDKTELVLVNALIRNPR